MIYISQNLSYKPRKDLHIYCPNKLESTYIEVLIPNKKSHLIGVVYKRPSMKHYKFNNDFMNTLLEKLTLENKPSIITGNFNLDLINYMQNTGVNRYKDISPTDTSPRETSPMGIFLDRQFPNQILPRPNISPRRHFPNQTFARPDISVTLCFSETFFKKICFKSFFVSLY